MSQHVVVLDNGSRSAGLIARLAQDGGWRASVLPLAALPAMTSWPDAIILSGTGRPAFEPGYEAELRLIQSCPVPMLGICGGMQLIGRAFGVGLDQGPPVIGRTMVQLRTGIALFQGMPAQVPLFQRHIYRLRSVPDGFTGIATSASCPVEGIGDPGRVRYGMQAHLEFRPEGKRILTQFLRLAAHQRTGPGRPASACGQSPEGAAVRAGPPNRKEGNLDR
jgi:GMP synthase (glutamine-hydrolysing)